MKGENGERMSGERMSGMANEVLGRLTGCQSVPREGRNPHCDVRELRAASA
ncbi:MAG: hypothetical protein IIV14_08360 [Bacteroidaceae bacterium]|nr:hypothetical protein [Bacteroidaceae bacterium]